MVRKQTVQNLLEMVQRNSIFLVAAEPVVARLELEEGTFLSTHKAHHHRQPIHAAKLRDVFDR